ncbi:hypothetical protein CVU76_02910 [Candidatus Dojkabacteria bacterium HGW-Dojkabacteria-1]|uniref:Uncharacterized protein n=1 Tax=Candidatus Dojkabacteria bacterium HGW-Dojkabacteria-1 TaxID=2013761 RepID=A0A2N2F415_9BACT|nr:MAG: hypothetical protein CVU76_02910 [Candidatus Dojkabacteria bacterium HGW-Dojkabacteria-1]
MKLFKKKLKGFGLTELVLAIGIFAIMSSTLLLLVVDSTRTLENSRARIKAAHIVEDINSTLLMIKSASWYGVARYTGEGEKHFVFENGEYTINEGQGEINGFTYSFSIEPAHRDSNGMVVLSGGTNDPHTRMVLVSIEWRDFLGRINTVNPVIFINDWDTNSIVYTTLEDFTPGEHDGTIAVNITGGEIRLQSMFYADWCNPSLSMSAYNLPGQGVASNISVYGENVFMGTGGNASGLDFMKIHVNGDPPSVSVQGEFNQNYKVNDVFGIGNIVLLATDRNDAEVAIIDTGVTPFALIGRFDSSGSQDGNSVSAYGNRGFVAHGSDITMFDISSFEGVRPSVTTISSGAVTDMFVGDKYIYAAVGASSNQFRIFEYTSNSIVQRASFTLNSANATSLYISEDTQRAYVTTVQNTGHEFFILDITNKTSPSLIGSYNVSTMNPLNVAAIDNRAIIVGTSGEEYLVLDITNESAPVRCGGLNVDSGVNALALVTNGVKYYTYVVTKDASQEFKIIQGGPGGGGADGNGYLPYGVYTSPIYDSESQSSTYYILGLTTTVPEGTSLRLQFRVSDFSNMAGSVWVGPDGTADTYYSISGIHELPSNLRGRYLQYRVIMESNTVVTPLVEEIVINYEK